MHSNRYTTLFIVSMGLIVAVALAFTYSALKPIHDANEEVFKKRDILSAVKGYLDIDIEEATTEQVQEVFNTKMEQVVIDANGQPVEGVKAEDY